MSLFRGVTEFIWRVLSMCEKQDKDCFGRDVESSMKGEWGYLHCNWLRFKMYEAMKGKCDINYLIGVFEAL